MLNLIFFLFFCLHFKVYAILFRLYFEKKKRLKNKKYNSIVNILIVLPRKRDAYLSHSICFFLLWKFFWFWLFDLKSLLLFANRNFMQQFIDLWHINQKRRSNSIDTHNITYQSDFLSWIKKKNHYFTLSMFYTLHFHIIRQNLQ